MSASAAALTCPGTGAWSSMKYDDATGNTTWYMKDGSVIVQDTNGNVIQNTQTAASSAAAGWTSDTNSDLTVQPGKTYQFKFTAANPGGINVWMGTPGVFSVTKAATETNAVYYKITAVGTPGAAAGVYVSYNGGSGTKLCVATVAGGGTSSGGATSNAPDTSGMTNRQKAAIASGLTLDSYNHEYEQEIFDLTNEERKKVGLPTFVWAKSLTELAQTRAKEIATQFSHTRPDGSIGGWENISMSSSWNWIRDDITGELVMRISKTPSNAVFGWMNSSGHRANILHTDAVAMAVGYYVAKDGTVYCVQCFTNNDLDLIDPITTTPLL